MVVQVLGEVPPELHVTPEQDERLAEQAQRVGSAEVVRLLELIAAALRAMKDGADARTQLELALVKAATPELEPSVKALLARLERLESGRPVAAAPAKTPQRAETAAGRAAAAPAAATPPTATPPPAEAAPPAPADGAHAAAPPSGDAPSRAAAPPPATSLSAGARRSRSPRRSRGSRRSWRRRRSRGPPPIRARRRTPPTRRPPPSREELATEADPTPAVTAVATVDPSSPAPAPSLELSLDAIGGMWPAVVDELRSGTPMLAAALEDAAPAALADDGLTLAWPESSAFLKRKAEDPANRELIAKAIRSVTGSSLRLAYELRDGEAGEVVATPTLSEDDLVQRFKDEFDAEELPPEPEEQT